VCTVDVDADEFFDVKKPNDMISIALKYWYTGVTVQIDLNFSENHEVRRHTLSMKFLSMTS